MSFHFFLLRNDNFHAFSKTQKLKGTFSDNNEQNICRSFHVLVKSAFRTSELELNYYHQKVNIRVPSRVVEWLKT